MNVSKKRLLSALEFPAKLASRRTSLPILNCVRLEATGGRLSIQASDLNQFVSIETDCDGDLEAICVSASRFNSAIHFAPKDTIKMTHDGTLLKLDTGDKLAIATLLAEEFPKFPEHGKAHGVNCADLSTGIKSTQWACREKDVFDYSGSVHILLTAKMMTIEGYGGVRAAKYEMPLICASCDIAVPREVALNLAHFLAQPECVLHINDKTAAASFKDGSYSCQLSEYKFPDSHTFWNQKQEKIGTIQRDELLNKFRSLNANLPSIDKLSDVKLNFTKKVISIHLNGTDETFDSEILGSFALAEVRVNGRQIQDALEAFEAESEIVLKNGSSSLFLECGNLIVASAPLRG